MKRESNNCKNIIEMVCISKNIVITNEKKNLRLLPAVARKFFFYKYIEWKFFQLSNFDAERQIFVLWITSTLLSPILNFEEL